MGKATETKSEEARQPYRIDILEHEEFPDVAATEFLTSDDFCNKANPIFRTAFADFEGTYIRAFTSYDPNDKNKPPVITPVMYLYLNHSEPNDPNVPNGVSREERESGNSKKITNPTLRRLNRFDSRNRNGDKFFLTDEACEALEEMFPDYAFNNKGRVDLSKIVFDTSVDSSLPGQPRIPATAVILDPSKVATKIYGRNGDGGRNFVYLFQCFGSVPTYNYPSNRLACTITRVSDDQVASISNKVGINFRGSGNIIRTNM